MSYILDALRKAEAERERGSVPGIHAQPMFPSGSPTAGPARARPWIALLGTAVVLLAAAVVWMLFGNNPATRDAAPQVGNVTPAPLPAAMPAPMVTASAPVPLVNPPPVVVAPVARAQPMPVRKPKAAASAPGAGEATTTAAVPAVPTAPAMPAAAASSPAEGRIYAVGELPDDIRRQLPSVAVGGSMYSATPANRILIINGQVLHEGDRIAPELLLQQIRLKAAVLVFKGYRYTLAF